MAVRFSCDGCGCMLEEGVEPKRIGTVLLREYCVECAPHAEEYMQWVSTAHTEIAREWTTRLAALRKEFFETTKLKFLPDADMCGKADQ